MGELITENDDVEFASDDDVRAGVERALAELGLTFEQLEAQRSPTASGSRRS